MLFLDRMCPWGDSPSTVSPCPVVLCQAEDCPGSTGGLSSGMLSLPRLSSLGRNLGDISTDPLPRRKKGARGGQGAATQVLELMQTLVSGLCSDC